MAAAKPLFLLIVALCAVPAAAGPIETSSAEAIEVPKIEAPAAAKPAAVDAPPVLPLFAGALAVLGWRLGRRRRQ